MTDTQEAMREEFEQQFPVADRIHWDIDQKSYRPNNPFDSAHVYAAAYQNMKLEGWQVATAQSAEKMARLEAEKSEQDNLYNKLCFRNEELHKQLAAAELSNKQLQGALKDTLEWSTYETEYDGRMYEICHSCGGQDGEHINGCSIDKYKALLASPEQKL